jgi:hypothetical protein
VPTRWCLGPCGRELPLEYFPENRHGHPGSRCRTCVRYRDRSLKRQRYRNQVGWRRRKLARNREAYKANRDQRLQYRRAYYAAHREQIKAYDRQRKRRLRKAA